MEPAKAEPIERIVHEGSRSFLEVKSNSFFPPHTLDPPPPHTVTHNTFHFVQSPHMPHPRRLNGSAFTRTEPSLTLPKPNPARSQLYPRGCTRVRAAIR